MPGPQAIMTTVVNAFTTLESLEVSHLRNEPLEALASTMTAHIPHRFQNS